MAEVIILPSKRRPDVQQYMFYVRNLLKAGDSVDTGFISVTVFSGDDPDPNHLFQGPLSQIDGTFYQVIRDGIPGVIYEFLLTVFTDLGETLTVEARLAILPSVGNAIPGYAPNYFSSKPYPILSREFAGYNLLPVDGKLNTLVKHAETQSSAASYGVSLLGGVLRFPLVTITTREQLIYTVSVLGGELQTAIKLARTSVNALGYSAVPAGGGLRTALIVSNCQMSRVNYLAAPVGGSLYVP